MPITVYAQFRMFARWPGLFIHPATTAAGVLYPTAMFSAIEPPLNPAAFIRSNGLRPSRLSCAK
jgi:hypothetical protein